MRDALIADLMRHLARQLGFLVDHAPSPIERQLEQMPLPTDVKRLLQWRWPRRRIALGPYDVLPAEEVLAHTDLPRLLSASMVPIGVAKNGDIVVLAFHSADHVEVGLVSHDELWEGGVSPAEVYVPVCSSVDEYLHRVAEQLYLPIDSFAADEWNDLRQEIERRRHGA